MCATFGTIVMANNELARGLGTYGPPYTVRLNYCMTGNVCGHVIFTDCRTFQFAVMILLLIGTKSLIICYSFLVIKSWPY